MKANVHRARNLRDRVHVIAMGDVSLQKEIIMTHTRCTFIKVNWHNEIVDQALVGFLQIIPENKIDVSDVPGAFEMPLLARYLACSGRYDAVAAVAFVVDGRISGIQACLQRILQFFEADIQPDR
jgi:6,7-dimethyl-8-ribityllumazine synthase